MAKILVKKLSQKKTFNKIVISAIALLLALGSYWWWKSTTNTNQQPFLALTYENKSYGIEMQYPDNWQLEAIADPFGTIAKFIPTNSQYSSSFSQTRASLGQHSLAQNTELGKRLTATRGLTASLARACPRMGRIRAGSLVRSVL